MPREREVAAVEMQGIFLSRRVTPKKSGIRDQFHAAMFVAALVVFSLPVDIIFLRLDKIIGRPTDANPSNSQFSAC